MLHRLLKAYYRRSQVPTVVHATHAKAGSSWVVNIFKELFAEHVAPRGSQAASSVGGNLAEYVFPLHRIYPAMFMSREEVLSHPELEGACRFFVMRDLRDTLVSLYFSLKVSHPLNGSEKKKAERETLQSMSVEEGLLYLLGQHIERVATIQRSWIGRDEIILRYEDLLQYDLSAWEDLLNGKLDLDVSRLHLKHALQRVSFQRVFKRQLGEEDVQSHGRRGAPGDWKNHFTAEVTRVFQEKYGSTLVATGYERDDDWARNTTESRTGGIRTST